MLGIHHYWLFIATAVILVITPGQDTFFILGRSLASGRAAGIAAALGITAGSIIHTFLAALGLSALLATSPYAFMAVKFAGAVTAAGLRFARASFPICSIPRWRCSSWH